MEELNLIVDSGLLFEGSDYFAWLKRITFTFCLKFDVEHPDDANFDCMFDDDATEEVAQLIKNNVYDPLLRRIPEDILKSSPNELVDRLQGLAKPFRLMDLPDHVRNRVYRAALPDRFCLTDERNKYPALLRSSSPIRAAVLPMFYSETIFDACHTFSAENIHKWAHTLLKQAHLCLLRRLECTWYGAELIFELSNVAVDGQPSTNLAITFKESGWKVLTSQQRRDLKAYVAAHETYGRAMGMQGEILVLLYTSRRGFTKTLRGPTRGKKS